MTLSQAARVRTLIQRIVTAHAEIRRDQRELDELMAEVCGYPRATLARVRDQLDELLEEFSPDSPPTKHAGGGRL